MTLILAFILHRFDSKVTAIVTISFNGLFPLSRNALSSFDSASSFSPKSPRVHRDSLMVKVDIGDPLLIQT